jgi:hypothetical protein
MTIKRILMAGVVVGVLVAEEYIAPGDNRHIECRSIHEPALMGHSAVAVSSTATFTTHWAFVDGQFT